MKAPVSKDTSAYRSSFLSDAHCRTQRAMPSAVRSLSSVQVDGGEPGRSSQWQRCWGRRWATCCQVAPKRGQPWMKRTSLIARSLIVARGVAMT
jgi:hypothetical protein